MSNTGWIALGIVFLVVLFAGNQFTNVGDISTISSTSPITVTAGANPTIGIDILTAGTDGDDTTITGDSGLQTVNGALSIMRGCGDAEILKWTESTDKWDCANDSGGGGGGGSIIIQLGDVTVVASSTVLDFADPDFDVTEGPSGEANVSLGTAGILELHLKAVDSAADEECLTFESSAGDFEWQDCNANIVDDDVPDTITIDLAALATALAANPADCSSNQFAQSIVASGNLTCAAIADADVPDSITITLAATATALAADPADCAADTKADSIVASGALTCSAVDTGDILDGTILEEDLKVVDSPVDEECLTFEATGGDFEWQSCGAGSSEWTDTGTALHPTETTDDVVIGATGPVNSAKLSIDGDADQIQFLIQESSGQASELFVIEAADGTDLLTVEANGELDLIYVSTANNEIAMDISVNALGFGNVRAIDIQYATGALGDDESIGVVLINIDETTATGGVLAGVEVLTTTIGNATTYASLSGVDVGPIRHESGTFVAFGFCEETSDDISFVDCLTAFSSTSTDIQIWDADDDRIYIGDSAKFNEIQWIFDTFATGPGIQPTFEFWNGSSWIFFSPIDGTNGARANGIMRYGVTVVALALDDWVVTTVDGDSAFWIRITRTANNTTGPTEDIVFTSSTFAYEWDKNGSLLINDVSFEGLSDDAFEHLLTVVDPTADRTFTFPDDTIADDEAVVGSGAGLAIFVPISDCNSTNVSRQQYDTATNSWTCDSDTIGSVGITDNDLLEVDLKVVDSPVDEECLTFEATGGDFEWQSCGTGGSAIVLDLGDDGGDDSIDLNEIATTGDTNDIFTEPSADKLLIDASNNWPTADAATALAADPTDCGANEFADAIAASGNLTCNAIVDADVPDTITIDLAATATALAADPADCAADTKADAIAASGALTCSQVDTGDITTDTITGNDINVNLAGRSLTMATTTPWAISADNELYIDTKGIWFEDPTAADDFESIWISRSLDVTLRNIWCESDQTVTIMLQIDDGSPADVDTVDLVCASTPDFDDDLNGDVTMAAGDRLDLTTISVSGTPTFVSIMWEFEYDD